MRKALVLLLVLLAAGIVGTVYASGALSAEREDITFAAVPLYGDPAFAENACVCVHTMLERCLLWDSTVTFENGEAVSDSTYRFSQTPYTDTREKSYRGVWLSSTLSVDEVTDFLYDQVPDGESREFHVRYADYYDYYPLHVMVELENVHYDNYGFDNGSGNTPEDFTVRTLLDTFRIPVLPDEYLDITVNKSGFGMSSGGGNSDGNAFFMDTQSVVTDDAVYFWFANTTVDGYSMDWSEMNEKSRVDTSEIPLGYGIYRLPYGYVDEDSYKGLAHFKGWDTKAEALSLFYAVDPSVRIRHLALSPDKEKLVLHAEENGVYVLTVLDTRTGNIVQRLELGTAAKFTEQYHGDDFVMVRFFDEKLCVLSWDADKGQYVSVIDAPAGKIEKYREFQPWYPWGERGMGFDGERFYVAGSLGHDWYTDETGETRHTVDWTSRPADALHCGFYLAVYDAHGLRYYGYYTSSLDDAAISRQNDPEPVYYAPVTVHGRK